jgi:hypothetical protein
MATITKRVARGKTVWGVRIRRKGQPLLTATFERLTDAKQWAARQEAAISESRAIPGSAARRHTVTDLIDRYRKSILPQKRYSTIRNQMKQLDWWQRQIGHLRLSDATPSRLSDIRDELLQSRFPATVTRYMAVLSHAFSVAMKEW